MPFRSPRVLSAILLAAAAGALAVRCLAIAQPLGIDQSLWASAVRGMSRGQVLYLDVWEQRPPGIYWIYLAGFQVLGWHASTVAWLDVLAATVTTLLLFRIAHALAGGRAGAATAALYAVLTMPAALYGHGGFLERSVSETFIAVAVAGAALAAVRLRAGYTDLRAGAIGLWAGAAVVLKPNAALYLPALLLWAAWYAAPATRASLRRGVAVAIAASAVVPLAAILWLWQLGALAEARTAVIDFNRFYVAEGFEVRRYTRALAEAVWLRMKTQPLWAAGGLAAVAALWELGRTRRLPPLAGLAVIWGGASLCVIVVNGARLFNSYFIQALPPLALLAAWLLAVGVRTVPRKAAMLVTLAVIVGLTAARGHVVGVYQWARADARALTGAMEREQYLDRFGGYANNRGYSARANAELAGYVREQTAAGDTVFLFGINGAGLYFAADRLTAHRFLRVNFYVETAFPDPRFRLGAVLDELGARKPKYLIFERLHSVSAMGRAADRLEDDPRVLELLLQYVRDREIEDFTLYRLIEDERPTLPPLTG